MPLVDAKCPNCGAGLKIDDDRKSAVCPYCREFYYIQDAINHYATNNYTHVDSLHADVLNVYGRSSSAFSKEQLLDRIKTFTLLGDTKEVMALYHQLLNDYQNEITKQQLLDYIKNIISSGSIDVAASLYSEYIRLYPGDYLGYWELFKIEHENALQKAATIGGIYLRDLIASRYIKNAITLKSSLETEYYSMVRSAISNYKIFDNPTIGHSDLPKIQTLQSTHPIRVSYEQGKPYIQKLNELREKWMTIMGESDYTWERLSKKICSILGLSSRSNETPKHLVRRIKRFSVLIGNTLMCEYEYSSEDYHLESILLHSPPLDIVNEIEKALRSCIWFMDGLCPYCGGKTSILNDTCKKCGKKRRLDL